MIRRTALLFSLLLLPGVGGCMSKFGMTRPIKQPSYLRGTCTGIGYGSPKGSGWEKDSLPVPYVMFNTRPMPPEPYVPDRPY